MCVTQRASQHVAARYYKLNRVTVPSELQKHVVSSVHHKFKKKKHHAHGPHTFFSQAMIGICKKVRSQFACLRQLREGSFGTPQDHDVLRNWFHEFLDFVVL